MLIIFFSGCEDDDPAQSQSSILVTVQINSDYSDNINLTNTVVQLENETGEQNSFTLTDNNKVEFGALEAGTYTVSAIRTLTNEEKSLYTDETDDNLYLTANQTITLSREEQKEITLDLTANKSFVDAETVSINQWIWNYMDLAYYWTEDMPAINIETEPDSKEYFNKLLKSPEDRWSFITDDIDGLLDYFQGITKSMGYSIQLYYLDSSSDQLVAIVEYVYSDTPASEAGLERGDLIVRIDGQIINLDNYQELLNRETMEITLGSITNNTVVELTPTVNLAAREINTNPIVKNTILEVGGKKIGYLAYTSFISNYDDQLVDVFTEFKSQNIDELVLDLRYNGGGSVNTAVLMASLIAPSSAINDVFINEKWNSNLTEYNETVKLYAHEANLNLNKLYVLTTEGTASASEMIIYGLEPYMDIIQIGNTTHGKYYASITLYDEEKRHNWGIQPIVLRSENKTNSINYSEGLPADYEADDIYYNAPLGDPEEQFLEIAISLITTGSVPATSQLKSTRAKIIAEGCKDSLDPLRTVMVVPYPKK